MLNIINTSQKQKKELQKIIKDITKKHINDDIIDLNMIDTSNIDNMSQLFLHNRKQYDISQWDVSNVKDMEGMFAYSEFNQDISNWNVSNVISMHGMFYSSKFNQDLTTWKNKIKDKKLLEYIKDYIK